MPHERQDDKFGLLCGVIEVVGSFCKNEDTLRHTPLERMPGLLSTLAIAGQLGHQVTSCAVKSGKPKLLVP